MNNAVTHYYRLCVSLRARVTVQQTGGCGGCMFNIINGNQLRSQWPRGLSSWVWGRSRLVGLWVRISLGSCLSLLSVVLYQVAVSATGRSLVQRIPTVKPG